MILAGLQADGRAQAQADVLVDELDRVTVGGAPDSRRVARVVKARADFGAQLHLATDGDHAADQATRGSSFSGPTGMKSWTSTTPSSVRNRIITLESGK